MVKMRPLETEILEYPVPTLLFWFTVREFHNSFGPSLGHSWSKPVSVETALRSGPRHCGQSRDWISLPRASGTTNTMAEQIARRLSMEISSKRKAGQSGQA